MAPNVLKLDLVETIALEYLKSIYTKDSARTADKKELIMDLDAAFITAENFVKFAIGRRNDIKRSIKTPKVETEKHP